MTDVLNVVTVALSLLAAVASAMQQWWERGPSGRRKRDRSTGPTATPRRGRWVTELAAREASKLAARNASNAEARRIIILGWAWAAGHGELPTIATLRRVADRDPRAPGPASTTMLEMVLMILRSDEALMKGIRPVDRSTRTARRRMGVALRLLPAKERERYRMEWTSEMEAMSPAVAAQFAANVLRRAPLTGISLRFAKLFGRQAA